MFFIYQTDTRAIDYFPTYIGSILIKLFNILSNQYDMSVTRGPKDDDSWNLSVHFKSDILPDWNYILTVVN